MGKKTGTGHEPSIASQSDRLQRPRGLRRALAGDHRPGPVGLPHRALCQGPASASHARAASRRHLSDLGAPAREGTEPALLTAGQSPSPPNVPAALPPVPTAETVAAGTPAAQDTTMVTVSCPPMNVTWALRAGPRTTSLDPKPCWGLHDTKYARAPAQLATSVPPREVSKVPPAVPGDDGDGEGRAVGERGGAACRATRGGGATREAGGETARRGEIARRGRTAARSAASLASARLTVVTLCCSSPPGIMPCPSMLTASRLPPVAALAPTSQAARPRNMRLCTSQGSSGRC